MITVDGLVNAIISKLDSEVHSCTKDDGSFDYTKWDIGCYLQAIYDYVKDNSEITVTYTGVVGTSPDPANGVRKYNPSIVSTEALKQEVISIQRGITEFSPNKWWSKLINSIQIHFVSKSSENVNTITVPECIIIPISTKSWTRSDFEGISNYKDAWRVICTEIIKSIKESKPTQVTPNPIPTTSSNSGSGSSVFVHIL